MIEIGSLSRRLTAQALVPWSSATTATTIAAARRPTARRSGVLASAFGTRLAVDAHVRPGNGLEALQWQLAACVLADAVGAFLDPRQRFVDLLHHLARGGGQQEVTLPLHVHGVAFARLFVELGVTRLALNRELLGLSRELIGLVQQATLLVRELLPQPLERLGREPRRRRRDLEPRQLADDRLLAALAGLRARRARRRRRTSRRGRRRRRCANRLLLHDLRRALGRLGCLGGRFRWLRNRLRRLLDR